MTIALITLCMLCVLLISISAWTLGKCNRQQLDIEKLYDAVAQLAKENAKIRKAVEVIPATQEEAAENLAKQIEKRWDSGLQSMLGWNPYDRGESEGG